MPKVLFLQDMKSVEVPKGTPLPVAVEMADAVFPFGCKMGSCGACRCLVVEGMENLNDLTEAEKDLFETLTHIHVNERLGCQLVIQGDVSIQA